MRVVSTQMGSFAALCLPPLPIHEARDFGVTRSLSQAWRIGRAIAICRQSKYVLCILIVLKSDHSLHLICCSDINGIAKAILEVQEGKCLFVGKIVDVLRVSLNRRLSQVTHDDENTLFRKLEVDSHGVRSASRNYVKTKSNTYPIV
jgi:hypothetical protein